MSARTSTPPGGARPCRRGPSPTRTLLFVCKGCGAIGKGCGGMWHCHRERCTGKPMRLERTRCWSCGARGIGIAGLLCARQERGDRPRAAWVSRLKSGR